MISLRFLKRSPGLENETDIQFREVSEEEEERVILFSFTFFWLQTEERTASGAVNFMSAGSGLAAGSRRSDPNRNPTRLRS